LGVSGLRELLGVTGRPLLCTAIKPMGFVGDSPAQMTPATSRAAALDLIKDDPGLADQLFSRLMRSG
jgi:ribulose-bisphosphate carboxylase large chain